MIISSVVKPEYVAHTCALSTPTNWHWSSNIFSAKGPGLRPYIPRSQRRGSLPSRASSSKWTSAKGIRSKIPRTKTVVFESFRGALWISSDLGSSWNAFLSRPSRAWQMFFSRIAKWPESKTHHNHVSMTKCSNIVLPNVLWLKQVFSWETRTTRPLIIFTGAAIFHRLSGAELTCPKAVQNMSSLVHLLRH